MLVLNPKEVEFEGESWADVSAVSVDREAARTVETWSDLGPHLAFADVPERRVVIKVMQELGSDSLLSVAPGDAGELSFYASHGSTDAGRKRVEADVVVTKVQHEVSLKRGAVRTVTCVAVSSDGSADPVRVTDA
jgi:hypothetical protein